MDTGDNHKGEKGKGKSAAKAKDQAEGREGVREGGEHDPSGDGGEGRGPTAACEGV